MTYRFLLILVVFIVAASCRKVITEEVAPELDYEVAPATLIPVTENVNGAIGGYYVGLPAKYHSANKKYPLLFFLHGGGQFGNGEIDLPLLLNEGIPELLDEKIFPPDFYVNGEHFSFVVFAPQFRRQPALEEVRSMISYVLENYRTDSTRIYMTGMSNGGRITCNLAAAYPSLLAAIVPMSGVPDTTGLQQKASIIAGSNLPVWIFHNYSDELIDIRIPEAFVQSIASHHTQVQPRLTKFTEPMGLLGHDAWTKATSPNYKEDNKNIYEWMLSYYR